MTKISLWMLVAVAVLLAVVSAQTTDGVSADQGASEGADWEMIAQRVAGTGGGAAGGQSHSGAIPGNSIFGDVYLINKRTGRVYKVFDSCGGTAGSNGCLAPLPAIDVDADVYAPIPPPQSGSSSTPQ